VFTIRLVAELYGSNQRACALDVLNRLIAFLKLTSVSTQEKNIQLNSASSACIDVRS